jgi:FkbH-like protein
MEIPGQNPAPPQAKTPFIPAAEAGGLDPRLERLAWQPVLFAEQPRRWELMKLPVGRGSRTLRLRIHRNHGFESTAGVMAPFLAGGNWQAEFIYSDYDDSLNFRLGGGADAEVIWLDYSRYSTRTGAAEFAAWLRARMLALRQHTDRPIILVNWPEHPVYRHAVEQALANPAVSGLVVGSLEAIMSRLGERFLDERMMALSGSRLSDAAAVLIARELACRWIPAVLDPRLKAVAVDLDDTLYAGVLGEDGPEGVVLTPAHRALQEYLLELRQSGIFLALVSRNEEGDVQQLFKRRNDFPLRWEDFSARQIHWRSKAGSLAVVAETLRIGMDAILYVDDNPGELATVAHAHPGLHVAHASGDPGLTRRVLEYFPGIWRRGDAGADEVRVKDLDANQERQEILSQAASPEDYLRSLQVSLVFRLNHRGELRRMQELSQKTNQFNLALKRFNEAEIERRFLTPGGKVVTIGLADRLSDSGVIGALFAREEVDAIVVEELCISCRALGRGLEDIIVAKALDTAWPQWPGKPLVFAQAIGPRNEPARQWLRRVAGDAWDAAGVRILAPLSFLESRPEYALLDIRIERTDE